MHDTKDICRSCLSTEGGLLSMDSIVGNSMKIKDCLQVHLSVNIDEDDGLPQKICLNCYDSLLDIRKFYLRYLQSEDFLMEQQMRSTCQKLDVNEISLNSESAASECDDPAECSYLDSETPSDEDENGPSISFINTKIEVLNNEDYVYFSDCDSRNQNDELKLNATSEDDTMEEAATESETGLDNTANNKLIYCLQCNLEFTNRNELRIHFHSVHGKDNAKGFCTLCSTTFPNRGTLMIHLQSHKVMKNIVKCSFCDKKFDNKNKLLSHERTHTGEKPYKCNICGRGFSQSSVLGTHMSLHTGKTVECPKCDKKFSRKSFLKVHLRAHDDIRPYACHLCDKKYRMKSHLNSHVLTHSNARNFTCDVCGQSFKEKCVLGSHMSIHTRPYKCPKCPLQAAKLYSFRIHLVKMHGISDDPKLFKRSASNGAVEDS